MNSILLRSYDNFYKLAMSGPCCRKQSNSKTQKYILRNKCNASLGTKIALCNKAKINIWYRRSIENPEKTCYARFSGEGWQVPNILIYTQIIYLCRILPVLQFFTLLQEWYVIIRYDRWQFRYVYVNRISCHQCIIQLVQIVVRCVLELAWKVDIHVMNFMHTYLDIFWKLPKHSVYFDSSNFCN